MSQGGPEPYRFDEVHNAPDVTGLYAWYHQFQLSNADIRSFADEIALQSPEAKRETAVGFILEHVFGPYKETRYDVEVTGKLKPPYRGTIEHQPRLSDGLVRLAAETPSDLSCIAELLQRSVPYFASPIYIGVAKKSLRQRLSSHRRLLSQYRENPQAPVDDADPDHSFAYEAVCIRRLLPADLLVYAMPIEFPDRVAVATENILNRVNYPLCGRN